MLDDTIFNTVLFIQYIVMLNGHGSIEYGVESALTRQPLWEVFGCTSKVWIFCTPADWDDSKIQRAAFLHPINLYLILCMELSQVHHINQKSQTIATNDIVILHACHHSIGIYSLLSSC